MPTVSLKELRGSASSQLQMLQQNAASRGYFLDPTSGTFKRDPNFRTPTEQVKEEADVQQAPLQTRKLELDVQKAESDAELLPYQRRKEEAAAVKAESEANQAQRNENLAANIISEVEAVSRKVNTDKSRIKQVKRYLGAVKQDDVDAAELLTMKAFIGPLIRQFGEKGALSDGDVARAINAIPNVSDTKPVAEAKLARLKRLVNKGQSNLDAGKSTTTQPKSSPAPSPTRSQGPAQVGRFQVEVE